MAKKKDNTPSLLSGTLPQLPKETGEPLTDINNKLNTYQSMYYPGALYPFQQAMKGVAERIYKAKQSADINTLGGTFGAPTQMSGGTFSDMLGWLEGVRGKSISSDYAQNVKAVVDNQTLLASDIQNLQTMKTNLLNNIQQFKLDLIKNAPGAYDDLSDKSKKSIEVGMPDKNVYALMDEFAKDAYERQKRMSDLDLQLKEDEHKLNQMKIAEGSPEQKQLKFIKDLQEAQQNMIKAREDRQNSPQSFLEQEKIDQEGGTRQANYGMYNDITDYWENYWKVLKNNPWADPTEVQRFLIDGLSPNDRLTVASLGDIKQNVEGGLYGAQKIVEGYRQKFGKTGDAGSSDEGVMKAHTLGYIDDDHYRQYMDATTYLMIYQ